MDHKQALEMMAVEKYLLNEFALEEREQFEEHFFSCHECAEDIRVGTALMEHGKQIFELEGPNSKEAPTSRARLRPEPSSRSRDWFAWLRPVFTVPALAILLVTVAVQNLVQVPALQRSLMVMNSPEVLPSAYLASGGTRGENQVVVAKRGQPFLLQVDIPGESNAVYSAELYDAAGQRRWPKSLTIPADVAKQDLPLRVPGGLEAGNYSLVVSQAGTVGPAEVGRYTFTLRLK
ncbi:hypothetical protein ACPOL_5450 [Acidisarcina polymorpha]|uniref:Zinc-finger domain-containing protein n=1 Tax=Acidisarcina polymorpha TaxID=2211140 RepID=A0A2Z5G6I1_9BACT|nr:zf-HC2 domain-containing protein [Acidisarcina polymorpha]AXC14698.1 hypothetical protein ACPOL_5450 [Acidisarcina polymorpha]